MAVKTKTSSAEWNRLKKKTKKLFDELGSVNCPAFPKEEVRFNSKGRNHLFYKGPRSERSIKDISIRVRLIPHAIEILKKMPIPQEEDSYSKNKKKYQYWAFEGVIKNRRVKVIVRQVGRGKKHLWSIAPAWRKKRFGRRNIKSGRLKNA